MGTKDYVLGTQTDELERLEFQHKVWSEQAFALWQRAGLREGQVVLDLGCGPGFTALELASVVGGAGRVIARDQSSAFLAFLAAESERRGLRQIEISAGPAETLELPHGSLDAVYSRWLFCWLANPGLVLQRVAKALRPGGVIVLQEYLDWAAMKHVPRDPTYDKLVAACMRSWIDAKARIDIAEELPALAAQCGLTVEYFKPIARVGSPGSMVWRWLQGFYETYLPKLIERGLLKETELRDGLPLLRPRGAHDDRLWVAPTMADIVLRKPQ